MRKLIMFLAGLVLLALTVAMIFLTSLIYDTTTKESVDTYFFQNNGLAVLRPGAPVRASDINESTMREMLIKKYVNEYFYVIPDTNNILNRINGSSVLYQMSANKVFDNWKNGEAVGMKSMAEANMLRTVEIAGEIYKPADSDYWIVPYVLKTWSAPNDMSLEPQITRGKLRMNIWYKSGVRDQKNGQIIDVGKYLKGGYNRHGIKPDPASIFWFGVLDLEREAND